MSANQRRHKGHRRRIRHINLIPRLCRQPPAATFKSVGPNNLFHHAHVHALLEAAKLTPVAPPFVDRAVFIGQADILGALLYGALEKSLTAFTSPKQKENNEIP